MSSFDITFQTQHHQKLLKSLIKEDGKERPAYIIFGVAKVKKNPWECKSYTRLLSHEVIVISDDELIESTSTRVSWSTSSFAKALRKAKSICPEAVVGIIHNHPKGIKVFSKIDDQNEPDLWQMAWNRNGEKTILPSLILTPDSKIEGRVWYSREQYEPVKEIMSIGKDIRFVNENKKKNVPNEIWNRQGLLFGSALSHDLARLRIGIVGCGGTGSAVAMLLARLGINKILLIDNDVVERTNLNRLHGACVSDAEEKKAKVTVVEREINRLGFETKVVTLKKWVDDADCQNALRSCHIIFGCTDDHAGRIYINRFSYFYLTPVFDLGLSITPASDDSTPLVQGRVTVLGPQHICLLCRNLVKQEEARFEKIRRKNFLDGKQHKEEAYVTGEGDPNPSVITFTTEVATMAVNEFLHRFQGFRGEGKETDQCDRFFCKKKDIRSGAKRTLGCRLCDDKNFWGRGDMKPFMDSV